MARRRNPDPLVTVLLVGGAAAALYFLTRKPAPVYYGGAMVPPSDPFTTLLAWGAEKLGSGKKTTTTTSKPLTASERALLDARSEAINKRQEFFMYGGNRCIRTSTGLDVSPSNCKGQLAGLGSLGHDGLGSLS